jgi:hypothetical protein
MKFPPLPPGETATAFYRSGSTLTDSNIVAVVVTANEVKFYVWDGVSKMYHYINNLPRLHEVEDLKIRHYAEGNEKA